MRISIPKPPHGTFVGEDVHAVVQECGCKIQVTDSGLRVDSCGAERCDEAHREVCDLLARKWGSLVVEEE